MPAKVYHVDLEKQEQDKLKAIVKKRKSTSESVKRSKILLAADRNGDKHWGDEKISRQYEVSARTVARLPNVIPACL